MPHTTETKAALERIQSILEYRSVEYDKTEHGVKVDKKTESGFEIWMDIEGGELVLAMGENGSGILRLSSLPETRTGKSQKSIFRIILSIFDAKYPHRPCVECDGKRAPFG